MSQINHFNNLSYLTRKDKQISASKDKVTIGN